MGIEELQEGVGQFGIFVLDLRMSPPRKERERFQQTAHIRVGTPGPLQAQPLGRPRMPLGEFLRELADVEEFSLVVGEQIVDHLL